MNAFENQSLSRIAQNPTALRHEIDLSATLAQTRTDIACSPCQLAVVLSSQGRRVSLSLSLSLALTDALSLSLSLARAFNNPLGFGLGDDLRQL